MKKFFSITLICLLTGFFIFANGQASRNKYECHIYFVDRQLHRLIPLPFSPLKTPEKTAKALLCELISGRDNNPEILRIIPDIKDSITVEISSNIACVNLSSELVHHINKNPETEKLVIYQIVNSLTSVEDINYVRFTIDNEVSKAFLGFLDMREIFTADYDT